MKSLRTLLSSIVLLSSLAAVPFPAAAVDNVLITEFMADNDRTLQDEDGNDSDWIEIYNAGTNTVNLGGWFLTDSTSSNTNNWWTFPPTNLPPNSFLIVFATGLDRRVPGAPLHTDFGLGANGDYLALIKPDGTNKMSQFGPTGGNYPRQVPDVSYGIPVTQTLTTLMPTGAMAKAFVPLGPGLDLSWITPEFNDASWTSATTGVGYETDGGSNIVVASSADDFSGVQGQKNWYYGYYNRTTDLVTGYQASNFVAFPSFGGSWGTDNYWNGSSWNWFAGDPPWDEIGQTFVHPNGINNGAEHWVIRRWISKVSGTVTIDWFLAKQNPSGNGVTGKIYHKDTQRDIATIAGNFSAGTNRSTVITGVQVGDTIDIILDPNGVGGTTDDSADGSTMTATIRAAVTLSNLVSTSIQGAMKDINSTAYLRIPFNVTNSASFDFLTLRMKYDDGFVAYLNGNHIVSRNAPELPDWTSTATSERSDADAVSFEDINITPGLSALREGANVLAIHGLNASVANSDFLILPELVAGISAFDPLAQRYFQTPTPGAINGLGTTNLGPLIFEVEHTPNDLRDDLDLVVTAQPQVTFNALSNLVLVYRVMFANEVAVSMNDNGTNNDQLAGDGIYTGVIPASASGPGQMVRYFIRANDVLGNFTRQPASSNAVNAPAYFGTVVHDPTLTNPLPVLHLFIPDATLALANNDSNGRYPCSISYLGEFYDNIGINRHGQSSTGFPKKSYDLDFHPGYNFKWKEGEDLVDDINLLTTYPDKSHMRNMLAYDSTFQPAGSPYHFVEPIRIQTNGGFYGDWHMMENGDDNYLKRIGRDPEGALYKMYNTFNDPSDYTISAGEAEKKTRKNEGNGDLIALYAGVNNASLSVRTNYMYDNINIAEVLNTLAARSVTSDWDCCHKNYYFYRDTAGTGEWEAMPWDIDLSFGRNWSGTQSYWDDTVYPANRIWGNWDNNGFFQVVLNMPLGRGIDATRQMYLRRMRTLVEELQQTNGTPAAELRYEKRMDELAALIAPDAAMDLVKWGSWGGGATGIFATNNQYYRTLAQEVDRIKTNYFPARRNFIFNTNMGLSGTDLINWTNAQPTNVVILISSIDYNPSSGNQAEEYIQLINTNRIAVDISGWRLAGAVEHTFQGGVVIPSSNAVYVAADKNAFRRRAAAPRGGMGLYVEGPYKGQLSARGETVMLIDKKGNVVRTNAYTGNPSGPQAHLRITEIMYHPPRVGTVTDPEMFEYIEFKNIGPTNISLEGVHFTSGVQFSFTGSAVTSLAPGAYVLVVRNLAAFTTRYGAGFNIAGEFVGVLDNAGENLRLDDAVGEKILDFDYNNSWYPITDGPGASLVIVNENAAWDTWGLKESWRPSASDFGSPALNDPAPVAVQPLLINELLTRTILPQVDAIEILNTNSTPANIGGWFLSDDFASPKKYRIPDGTTIPAGGYLVFREDTSFGLGPNAFAISSTGDETYLFSGNGTNLTGYLHGYSFGGAETGVSFGRYINSQTNVHFVAMSTQTLSNANSTPKVGPVVISEINYRPEELPPGANNEIDEYVEIANISGAPVQLWDAANAANTWRLRGGVDFDFPQNITIPAGGHVVLVSFNPAYPALQATFRARFGVPQNVPVFGPFSGRLDNTGESLRLWRPDSSGVGGLAQILVDEVEYANQQPWPIAADGLGASLQRLVESAYGNDPTNWTAVSPSVGSAYLPGGIPPTIVTPPANRTVAAGRTAMFSVEVAGTSPFVYRWRFNGTNIGGAGSTLTLPGVQFKDAGSYSVIVRNSAGSIESPAAQLTVLAPPFVTQQPVGRAVIIKPDSRAANLPNGTNVTFTTAASSANSSVTYQWLLNGTNLPGEINPSITITNVQLEDEGDYVCAVTDTIDTILSATARLSVWYGPILIEGTPVATNFVTGSVLYTNFASAGSPVRLGLTVIGNPAPRFYWRLSTSQEPLTPVLFTDDRTNSFSYTTPNTPANLRIFGVVTNASRPTAAFGALGNVAVFNITTLADNDQDGIPDNYEIGLGLNTNNAADALEDLDLDGSNNRAEFIAGTDPNDNQSHLKVEMDALPGAATVEVSAIANRSYTVQYTDAFGTGLWTKLADLFARATNRVEVIADPGWTTNRFYRVVTPQQP